MEIFCNTILSISLNALMFVYRPICTFCSVSLSWTNVSACISLLNLFLYTSLSIEKKIFSFVFAPCYFVSIFGKAKSNTKTLRNENLSLLEQTFDSSSSQIDAFVLFGEHRNQLLKSLYFEIFSAEYKLSLTCFTISSETQECAVANSYTI